MPNQACLHFCPKLPISAHVWAFLPMSGHFWAFLAKTAYFCPFLARNCPCLGISAQNCLFPPMSGHFRPCLGISAQFWPESAHFWPEMPARARPAQACLPGAACAPLYMAKLPKLPRFQFCPFFPVGVHFHLNDLDLEFFLDFLHGC